MDLLKRARQIADNNISQSDAEYRDVITRLTQLCDEQGAEIKRLSDWTSGGITWKKTAQIMRDKEAADSRAAEWASRCGKLQAEPETAVDALSQAREEIQKEKAKVLSWQRSNARKATPGARTLMDLEASEQREKVLQGKIQWYADYANDQDKSVTREMARANKAEQREKVLLDLIAVAPHDINCFPIRVMRLTPGAFALQYGDQKVECDCWKAKAALAAAGKGEESDGTR